MPTRNPDRRTQEERSAETRARILDATVACLIEHGYAGTSTPEVCRRAQLSRGALLHHFPTKAQLVIDAVTYLAAMRGEKLSGRRDEHPPGGDPLGAIFATLWEAFADPAFHAGVELWVAARTDPELLEALVPVERVLGKGISRLWSGDQGLQSLSATQRKGVNDLVALTLHTLRGMALQRILKPDDSSRRRLFQMWERMAKQEYERLRELG